jgi:biotin carboxylase
LKKLAIIGASYLQLPLVLKAKEMGVETHCFAWAEGAVCRDYADYFHPVSVLEKEEILQKCLEIQIDGITTIATDMAVPTICYVAEKMNLVSNSYASSLKSTNKAEMRAAFRNAGCRIPGFRSFSRDVPDVSDLRFPLIVKPADRSGSRGVTKITFPDELPQAAARALKESFSGFAIAEEFIDGVEVSVETISYEGRHFVLSITDKTTTGPPYFVELAHHQPSQLPPNIQEKIRAETQNCLNALDITSGAGHSEFKITEEGEVFVIEVGARMGGDFIGSHLVELSTGYDFLKGVIQLALGRFEEPLVKDSAFSGVYFLCSDSIALLPYMQQKNDFDFIKEIQNIELKKITSSNDRSGYLIYKSDNRVNLL